MKWGLVLIAVLLVPIANAARIDTSITTATMGDAVSIKSEYVIVSQAVEDLTISLPPDVTDLYADMDGKQRTCKVENSTAYCGSTKAAKHVFTIAYESTAVLGKLDKRRVFKHTEQLPFQSKQHTFVLKLPIGNIIPKEDDKDEHFYLTPKPSEVLSDGQRIIITWKTNDATNFAISAVTEPLVQETNWTWLAFGISIAGAAGAAITWYALRKKLRAAKQKRKPARNGAPKPDLKAVAPQFVEHEQKVVELLQRAENNELWQKQLLQETAFSKAKLSRIVRNLEERGVITKTIYGNTNKIAIKK